MVKQVQKRPNAQQNPWGRVAPTKQAPKRPQKTPAVVNNMPMPRRQFPISRDTDLDSSPKCSLSPTDFAMGFSVSTRSEREEDDDEDEEKGKTKKKGTAGSGKVGLWKRKVEEMGRTRETGKCEKQGNQMDESCGEGKCPKGEGSSKREAKKEGEVTRSYIHSTILHGTPTVEILEITKSVPKSKVRFRFKREFH